LATAFSAYIVPWWCIKMRGIDEEK